MTSKYFWNAATNSRARRMSSFVRFSGIGEVNEQLAARAFHRGADLLQHGGPDVAHVGEHGPIDERRRGRRCRTWRANLSWPKRL